MKISTFMRNSVLTIAAVVVLPLSVYAAPAVSSVSGTVTHGSTVIISGAGFGTKNKVAPVLWDTVDNIPSYAGLSDGATIPVGGSNPWPAPYGNSSGSNNVKLNTSDAHRGKGTKMYKATNTSSGYLDGLTWTGTNQAYVSWWWKQNVDVSAGNHSSKFLRMSSASDETGHTFSWEQMADYVYAGNYCQNGGGESWDSWGGNPNVWNFLEVWFDSSARTYTVRVNGKTLSNNVSWSGCSSFQFNELWKIGFDGGGVAPPSITWWMDDIYVDSSFSRVMICNASTYAASTHCEMQIPNTTWQDNQIQINVNQGSFADSSTAYLYVVDASGNVSAGNTITFGASGSQGTQGTTVPEAPLLK